METVIAMKTETVTCDTCRRDLGGTTNCEAYRLRLTAESIPVVSQVVTLMMCYAPIKQDRHYCSIHCLVNDSTLMDIYRGSKFKPADSADGDL
jgi:predicted phosphohydrolase